MKEKPSFLNPEQEESLESLKKWVEDIYQRWPQIRSRGEIDRLLPQAQLLCLEVMEIHRLFPIKELEGRSFLPELFKLAQEKAFKADQEHRKNARIFLEVRKSTRPSIWRGDPKVNWSSRDGYTTFSDGPEICAKDLNLFSVVAARTAVWANFKDLPGFEQNIYLPLLKLFDLGAVRIGQKEAGQLTVHFPVREENGVVLACCNTNETWNQRRHPVTDICSRLELPGMKYLRFLR